MAGEDTVVSPPARVSTHAIERYVERVDSLAAPAAAAAEIYAVAVGGRSRPTPRRWMRRARKTPGVRFVYDARRPGVCAVVMSGVIVTVVASPRARRMCDETACRADHQVALVAARDGPWDGER